MTNILAFTVMSLVTNVTVTDNTEFEWVQVPCPDAAKSNFRCLVLHQEPRGVRKPATEKTEVHTVYRVTQAVTEAGGRRFTNEVDRVELSATYEKKQLVSEWRTVDKGPVRLNDAQVRTNLVPPHWQSIPAQSLHVVTQGTRHVTLVFTSAPPSVIVPDWAAMKKYTDPSGVHHTNIWITKPAP